MDYLETELRKIVHWRTTKLAALVFGCAGLCYLFWKLISLQGIDLSFRYIWIAGSIWLDGGNPYGEEYFQLSSELFEGFNGQPFYYPPNWWAVAQSFALFDYSVAMEIWRFISISCVLASSLFLYRALKSSIDTVGVPYMIFYTGLVSLMQITAVVLATGQTVILMYLGMALTASGVLKTNRVLTVIGLSILLLKPQIGVPLCCALLMVRKHQITVLWTGIVGILLAAPAFVITGPVTTLKTYFNGLSQHANFPSNAPEVSTGLKNILAYTMQSTPSSTSLMIIAILVVLVVGYLANRKSEKITSERQDKFNILYMILAVSLVAFFSPLHEYDMLILLPMLLLATAFELKFQAIFLMVFIAMCRTGNIGALFGFTNHDEERIFVSVVYTIALLLLIGAAARKFYNQFHKTNEQ